MEVLTTNAGLKKEHSIALSKSVKHTIILMHTDSSTDSCMDLPTGLPTAGAATLGGVTRSGAVACGRHQRRQEGTGRT